MHTDIAPSEALRELLQWRLPTATHAIEQLYQFREQTLILQLYRDYFPKMYAASTASCIRVNGAYPVWHPPLAGLALASASVTQGYSAREREFLKLVNDQLFPLDLDAMEEWADDGDAVVCPLLVNPSCFELEFDELSLPLQVFVALLAVNDVEVWDSLRQTIGYRAPRPITTDGQSTLNWERFSALCYQHRGLMGDVPLAMDVVAHATGNWWLDCDENTIGYERFEWDRETVDFLTAEWQQAQSMLKQYDSVIEWLKTNRRPLATIIHLWNRSIAPQTA